MQSSFQIDQYPASSLPGLMFCLLTIGKIKDFKFTYSLYSST